MTDIIAEPRRAPAHQTIESENPFDTISAYPRTPANWYNRGVLGNDLDSSADASLAADIQQFIDDPTAGEFGDLFLRLFKRQYARNDAYRIFCDNGHMTPDSVHDWRDVPAVPAAAFKSQVLSCRHPEEAVVVFHSSGTTDGRPGRHYLDETAVKLYRASLCAGFYRCLPAGPPLIALMPPPTEAPHSSLSFMLGDLGAEFYWNHLDRLSERLDDYISRNEQVCVFGTAFGLVDLFDTQSRSWRLPEGSHVIDTGGLKGRTRYVERGELYAMIEDRLSVRPPLALAEYGMSEMASQYYGAPGRGLTGGHWVRARIINPITQMDASEGLLRHYDLANWNSVAAIETQDLGRWCGQADEFEMLGRAPSAELRGCSLTVEERWMKSDA